MGQEGHTRNEALRGLLSALWSFLQHPAVHLEEHLATVEERLKSVEARLVGDLQTAVDTGVVAVEESIHSRVAGIQARLEAVRKRVVEDLKRELHHVLLVVALLTVCAGSALIAVVFGLMAAWAGLRDFIGSVGASLVLAIAFVGASLVVLAILRSVLHRTRGPKDIS
jgi:prephenate dehydratase